MIVEVVRAAKEVVGFVGSYACAVGLVFADDGRYLQSLASLRLTVFALGITFRKKEQLDQAI